MFLTNYQSIFYFFGCILMIFGLGFLFLENIYVSEKHLYLNAGVLVCIIGFLISFFSYFISYNRYEIISEEIYDNLSDDSIYFSSFDEI